MVYSYFELPHSMNIIYEAEEYDVRYGLLVSALQDPFKHSILTGFSVNVDGSNLRIDGGVFVYDETVVQVYNPILVKQPSSIQKTVSNIPDAPLLIPPPPEGVTEYPPGYVPPIPVTGEEGSGGGGEEDVPPPPQYLRVFDFTPGISVRWAPNIDTGEYAVVDSFSVLYLEKETGVKVERKYDFHNFIEVVDEVDWNSPAVVFKYIEPNKIRVTEFKSIINNTDEHEDQTLDTIQAITYINHNELSPTETHPFIRTEAIIELNDQSAMLCVAVDDEGNVNLYDYEENRKSQTILRYEGNNCAVIFWKQLLIIDARGLTLVERITYDTIDFKLTVNDKEVTLNENFSENPDSESYDKIDRNSSLNLSHRMVGTVKEIKSSGIINKYYWIEIWDKFPITTRGLVGIFIQDSTTLNNHLDESFIGYSLTFNGADNWLYMNNIDNDYIMIRFPTYDPVLSTPISAEVINAAFHTENGIDSNTAIYSESPPIYDIFSEYAENTDSELMQLIIETASSIQTDDEQALNATVLTNTNQNEQNPSNIIVNGTSVPVYTLPESSVLNNEEIVDPTLTMVAGTVVELSSQVTLDTINTILDDAFLSDSGDLGYNVYTKLVVSFIYFKDSNVIRFELKDATDLTPYDTILATLVFINKNTFFITYRDFEYPRMIPYAEWNDIDMINYMSSFLPSYGNEYTPIVIQDSQIIAPTIDMGDSEYQSLDGYSFTINSMPTVVNTQNPMLSGTGTPGLIVQAISYTGERCETVITDSGFWDMLWCGEDLGEGTFTFSFEVYNENDELVATGRTNTFKVDTSSVIYINEISDKNSSVFTITGIGEPKGEVKVWTIGDDGLIEIIGTTTVADNGYWSVENTYQFTDGVHKIYAEITDSVGNTATAESNEFMILTVEDTVTDANDTNPEPEEEAVPYDDGGSTIPPEGLNAAELITGTLVQYASANILGKLSLYDFDKVISIVDFQENQRYIESNGFVTPAYIGLNQGQYVRIVYPFFYVTNKIMVLPVFSGANVVSDLSYDMYLNGSKIIAEYEYSSDILDHKRYIDVRIESKINGLVLVGFGFLFNQYSLELANSTRINHLKERSGPVIKYLNVYNNKINSSILQSDVIRIHTVKANWELYDINGLNVDVEIYGLDNRLLSKFNNVKDVQEIDLDIILDYIELDRLSKETSDAGINFYKYPIRFEFKNPYDVIKHTHYLIIEEPVTEYQGSHFGTYQVIEKANLEHNYIVIIILELLHPVNTDVKVIRMYLTPTDIDPIAVFRSSSSFIAIEYNFEKNNLPTTIKLEYYIERNMEDGPVDEKLIEIRY